MAKRRSRLPLVVTSLVIALALVGSLYLAYTRGTGPFKTLLASRSEINLVNSGIKTCSAISDIPEVAATCAANKAKSQGVSKKGQEQIAKQAAKEVTQKLVEEKLRTKTYKPDKDSSNPAASQTAAAAADVASDLGVTVTPGGSSSQIVSQVAEKAVAQPIVRQAINPPTPAANLDDITSKERCGKGNIPMYSGYTYASGLAADKDGNVCNAALSPTTCKYRHCVTWTTEGDDQCVRKDVVCGDAYRDSPTTTVLMLGGAYTLSSNGEQQPLTNSCFTKSGDLVPNGTKRNKDANSTETCVDGVWTTQDKLIAANNKLCEERYPGQGYEFNDNYKMCMLSSGAAEKLKATLTSTYSITNEKNPFICANQPGAQWNNGKCECKAGFALNPFKLECSSTASTCKDKVQKTYLDNKWTVTPCGDSGCNSAGTMCAPRKDSDIPYSSPEKCMTGLPAGQECKEVPGGYIRVPKVVALNPGIAPYETRCTNNTLMSYSTTPKPGKWVFKESCKNGCSPDGKSCNDDQITPPTKTEARKLPGANITDDSKNCEFGGALVAQGQYRCYCDATHIEFTDCSGSDNPTSAALTAPLVEEAYAPWIDTDSSKSIVSSRNACPGSGLPEGPSTINGEVVYKCKSPSGNYISPSTGLALDGSPCRGNNDVCDSGYCRKRLSWVLGIDWLAADQCAPKPSTLKSATPTELDLAPIK